MPVSFTDDEVALLGWGRVGHLATVDEDGQPHVVPVCYALHDGVLYTPIDEKPKRSQSGPLRRVHNIEANARACLTVDRYDEDWAQLAWVQVRGIASLIQPGDTQRAALSALRSRYAQYRSMNLEIRPVIQLTPQAVRSWRAA